MPIGNVTHVAADFAVGPEIKSHAREQLLHAIVLLHQVRHLRRRLGRFDIGFIQCGLRIKTRGRHVLADYRNERQPERLVEIGDELVARHIRECRVVVDFRFPRQVPVHVLRIPPGVLQPLPEEPRLANAPDFVPPRDDSLLAELHYQLPQRIHQPRRRLLQALVIRAERLRLRIILRVERQRNAGAGLHRLCGRIAVGFDGCAALRVFQDRVFRRAHLPS